MTNDKSPGYPHHADVPFSEAGPLPIIVWRTCGDQPTTAGRPSGLANRLVSVYTLPGDCVVDFDADSNLNDATDSLGRQYLALTHPADVADLDRGAAPTALVVTRWPRPGATRPPSDVLDLFTACRFILAADAHMVFVIASTHDTDKPSFADHADPVLSAAQSAGFRPVHTILAIATPTGPDTFTYYATPDEYAHDPKSPYLNLLVFAVGSA